MGHLEGNFTPVLYKGRKVLKGSIFSFYNWESILRLPYKSKLLNSSFPSTATKIGL